MGIQENAYPLRVDRMMMEKTKYLAKENSRSVNKEIEFALKQHISAYEKEHGAIAVPEE